MGHLGVCLSGVLGYSNSPPAREASRRPRQSHVVDVCSTGTVKGEWKRGGRVGGARWREEIERAGLFKQEQASWAAQEQQQQQQNRRSNSSLMGLRKSGTLDSAAMWYDKIIVVNTRLQFPREKTKITY